MRPARVKCPAKLNLYLDISFRMPNGYHIMEMVMQTVNLFDTVYLTLRDDSEIHLTMDNSDIPADKTNIAWRCARALLDAAGSREGVNIRIHKQIPAQAGLGGGSADGAGVLVGLNALLNSPLSEKALCDLGAKIGADIPFCLVGGTAVVRGYGEIIEPIDPLPPCHILIAKPAVGISTAACFARYDESGIPLALPGTPPVKAAIQKGDIAAVGKSLYNVLERVCDCEEIDHIKSEMLACGAAGSLMSGSGSAVFGLFARTADAEAAARRLKQQRYFVRRCSPIQYGASFVG